MSRCAVLWITIGFGTMGVSGCGGSSAQAVVGNPEQDSQPSPPAAQASTSVVTRAEPVAVSAPLASTDVTTLEPAANTSASAPTPSASAKAPEPATQDRELSQLLALGNAALEREDYANAIEQFRKARRRAANHPAPVVGLVQARFGALGLPTEYKGAEGNASVKELIELVGTAIELDANYGPAHLERGRLLLLLGNNEQASASLLQARASLPENPEVHSLLAIVSLASGKVPEALVGFEQAARLEPNNPERLTNWGTTLMLHGDVQQAISVFRRSVSIDPNNARSRGDLGTALLSTNDIAGALPHLQKAHELAPEKATFMSNLGYAQQRLGDEPSALAWYQRAIQADPKLGSAWINLGTLYAEQHKYSEAEAAFRRALQIDPEDPRAKSNLDDLQQLRAGGASRPKK